MEQLGLNTPGMRSPLLGGRSRNQHVMFGFSKKKKKKREEEMSRNQSKDSPTVYKNIKWVLLNIRLIKKPHTNISCIGNVIVNE